MRPAVVIAVLAIAATPATAAPIELGARLGATVNGVLAIATGNAPAPTAASAPVAPRPPSSGLGIRLRLPSIADVQVATDPLGSGPLLAVDGGVRVGDIAAVDLGAQADVNLAPAPAGSPLVRVDTGGGITVDVLPGSGAAPSPATPGPGAGSGAEPTPPGAPGPAQPRTPSAPVGQPGSQPSGSATPPPGAAPTPPAAGAQPDASMGPPRADDRAPSRDVAGSPAPGVRATAETPAPASPPEAGAASPAATSRPTAAEPGRSGTRRLVEAAVGVVADAARSPWLIVGVILAALAYLLGQRILDRGSRKLNYAGRPGEPDDELIEL